MKNMKNSSVWLIPAIAFILITAGLIVATRRAYVSLSIVSIVFCLIIAVICLALYKREKRFEQFKKIFGVDRETPGVARQVETTITIKRQKLEQALKERAKAKPGIEYTAAVKEAYQALDSLEQAVKSASQCGFEELARKIAFPAPSS